MVCRDAEVPLRLAPVQALTSSVGWFGRLASGALVSTIGILSRRGLERLARALGWLAWTLRIRRRVTIDNLAHAFPELDDAQREQIARGAYFHMALAALEALGAVHLTERDVVEQVQVEGFEAFERAMQRGGVLVATAHFGSWELLASVMSRRGIPFHAVVRPLRGAVNARIVESRTRSGVTLIPPRGALMASVKAVRAGATVVMLVDQVVAPKHGVRVPFFGRLASTNPALATAALRTGAPVFLVMGAREGSRLRMFCEGPFEVPRTGDGDADIVAHTAEVTGAIERYIRRYPEQWLWMHRRWKH